MTFPIYGKIKFMFQTTNQYNWGIPIFPWYSHWYCHRMLDPGRSLSQGTWRSGASAAPCPHQISKPNRHRRCPRSTRHSPWRAESTWATQRLPRKNDGKSWNFMFLLQNFSIKNHGKRWWMWWSTWKLGFDWFYQEMRQMVMMNLKN